MYIYIYISLSIKYKYVVRARVRVRATRTTFRDTRLFAVWFNHASVRHKLRGNIVWLLIAGYVYKKHLRCKLKRCKAGEIDFFNNL